MSKKKKEKKKICKIHALAWELATILQGQFWPTKTGIVWCIGRNRYEIMVTKK